MSSVTCKVPFPSVSLCKNYYLYSNTQTLQRNPQLICLLVL